MSGARWARTPLCDARSDVSERARSILFSFYFVAAARVGRVLLSVASCGCGVFVSSQPGVEGANRHCMWVIASAWITPRMSNTPPLKNHINSKGLATSTAPNLINP